eukprot:CAMPEP_0119138934 /NCGR_PEP_ID=MMETSP1310-20130426/26607_1 /TAXON_ID=464262 /ORGANISM="Genus nov. species nov., Strain RCC2339" /LENGTH=46 /DNA_ID= /DNA_START= /DNA_END= /DNA_ORIENTATION=
MASAWTLPKDRTSASPVAPPGIMRKSAASFFATALRSKSPYSRTPA